MNPSSPLRPLPVILEVDHGGAWQEITLSPEDLADLEKRGFSPSATRRYWVPEAHGPEGTNPMVISGFDTSGRERACRFCSCAPGHHGIPHPTLTIAVNPSLVTSVMPLDRPAAAGIVIVRTTYQRRATQTLPGMVIGYDEEYYLVAGTVDEVLAMLSWPT